MNDVLSPLAFSNGVLSLLDQRRLPTEEVWIDYRDYREVAAAIRDMVVRGAPAIGCTAAYGVAIGAMQQAPFDEVCEALAATRPTAINLFWAIERMKQVVPRTPLALARAAIALHEDDIASCRAIGKNGAALLPAGRVLTHCNAGALATGGYGTALGVIRAAVESGTALAVYADETRPFLQGARLTAWELQRSGIPTTLITDNMAGHFMAKGAIQSVVVGADRIAANGDTANKIGTFTVAVLAREHNIPFFVAAPLSTIDRAIPDGTHIPIEERSPREVTHIGPLQVAPDGIAVANPAFDVTPARLITAIITEAGVARPPYRDSLAALFS
ncbi:MAG: S-methyl-5-thioribose-1-phosphate isomerase [Myxococcales bacterium]|nr:S-methyl-5-thioribose-1-phosphate isomerase [Myxococcales bacterium]